MTSRTLRLLPSLFALLRALPAALEREYLKAARASLQQRDPMHADLPWIVARINYLETTGEIKC